MARAYTGIDIGSNALKIAACEGGAVRALAVEALPEGLMDGQRIVSHDAMADFLKRTVKAQGGVAKDVALVLPSDYSLVRRMEMPVMDHKELVLNLPFEFHDFIEQGKDRYFYDYAVLGPVLNDQSQLSGMDVLACAAPKDVIVDFGRMLSRAGLRLRTALPAVAALQDALERSESAQQDCCVIDFAHRHTRLHFFARGRYDVTRTIELGGRDVDRAIAEEMGVEEHLANEYKISNFKECLQLQRPGQVFETMAVEITRALNFYGFNNPEQELTCAYCVGGGANLGELVALLEQELPLPLLPASRLLGSQLQDESLAACAAAVGATLKAE